MIKQAQEVGNVLHEKNLLVHIEGVTSDTFSKAIQSLQDIKFLKKDSDGKLGLGDRYEGTSMRYSLLGKINDFRGAPEKGVFWRLDDVIKAITQ